MLFLLLFDDLLPNLIIDRSDVCSIEVQLPWLVQVLSDTFFSFQSKYQVLVANNVCYYLILKFFVNSRHDVQTLVKKKSTTIPNSYKHNFNHQIDSAGFFRVSNERNSLNAVNLLAMKNVHFFNEGTNYFSLS